MNIFGSGTITPKREGIVSVGIPFKTLRAVHGRSVVVDEICDRTVVRDRVLVSFVRGGDF